MVNTPFQKMYSAPDAQVFSLQASAVLCYSAGLETLITSPSIEEWEDLD